MERLNHKGFAITGILYTVLIVFLLVLVSILGGLQARKMMLENSLIGLEESYVGDDSHSDQYVVEAKTRGMAPVTGKYIFEVQVTGDTKTYTCSSYLVKNMLIDYHQMSFLCDKGYTYGTDSPNELTLTKVYSFEEN